MTLSEPRGLRNNNPGNIRHGKSRWKGMAAAQPDKAFVRFKTPFWGIRAMTLLLLNYHRMGRDSVRQVIERWAPPVENDTGAYVSSVAQSLGVAPDAPLDWASDIVIANLVRAIIRHENGVQPYHLDLIHSAVRDARIG